VFVVVAASLCRGALDVLSAHGGTEPWLQRSVLVCPDCIAAERGIYFDMTTCPKSPKEMTRGMMYFPRMLDKIRLHARGELNPDLIDFDEGRLPEGAKTP
jgi:hypothetical protein